MLPAVAETLDPLHKPGKGTLWSGNERVIPNVRVYFVLTQFGNFWSHPPTLTYRHRWKPENILSLRQTEIIECMTKNHKSKCDFEALHQKIYTKLIRLGQISWSYSLWRRRKWQVISPWRWRQQDPPKRWYPTSSLHRVTIQKNSTWIFTAVKTKSLAP
jgi:hypothetical protein